MAKLFYIEQKKKLEEINEIHVTIKKVSANKITLCFSLYFIFFGVYKFLNVGQQGWKQQHGVRYYNDKFLYFSRCFCSMEYGERNFTKGMSESEKQNGKKFCVKIYL